MLSQAYDLLSLFIHNEISELERKSVIMQRAKL